MRGQKHNKIVLLVKTKLNTIEVLSSKALINSCVNDDQFVSVDNVLREYNEIKEEIKNPENDADCTIWKHWKRIVSFVKKVLRKQTLVLGTLNKIDQCLINYVLFVVRKAQVHYKSRS